MSIGLAIIAQNNAFQIPICLSQFYHVVDDIVVVDGGSTDHTPSLSRRFGARVFYKTFPNDFSAQRNYAMSLLSTDWIYFHDTDERVEPALALLLPELTSPEGQRSLMSRDILPRSTELFDCFGFARKTFIDGVFDGNYPDYQYRLFRNYCRFEGKVHERLVGYHNRAEVDFRRPPSSGIEPLRIDFPSALDVDDSGLTSRFNILHYQSKKIKQEQEILHALIMKGSHP